MWGSLDGHGKRDVTTLLYISPEEGGAGSPPRVQWQLCRDILVYNVEGILVPTPVENTGRK